MRRVFLALVVTVALLLTACGTQTDDNDANTTKVNPDVTTEVTEQNRANTPDNLPNDLNFNGETVNIYYFGYEDSHYYDAVGRYSVWRSS